MPSVSQFSFRFWSHKQQIWKYHFFLAPTTFCLGKIGTKFFPHNLSDLYKRKCLDLGNGIAQLFYTLKLTDAQCTPHINWTKYMFDCFKCHPQRHHPFKQDDFIPKDFFQLFENGYNLFILCGTITLITPKHPRHHSIYTQSTSILKMEKICTYCKAHDMKEGVGVGFVL